MNEAILPGGSRRREPTELYQNPLQIPLSALEQTLESVQLGLAEVDVVSDALVSANSSFRELLNLSPEQIVRQAINFKNLVHPNDRRSYAAAVSSLLCEEISASTIEQRLVLSDGGTLPVRATLTALAGEGRSTRRIVVVIAPLNSAPQTALQDLSPSLATASQWAFSFVTRTSTCSPGLKTLLGRPISGQLLSFRDAIAQICAEDRNRVIQDVLRVRKGQCHSTEFRINRLNGELRWVSQTVTPVITADDEVIGAVATCLDITDAKRFVRQTSSAQTVRAVKQHVDQHWDRPLSVADLANAAGVNARTLFKHFKQDCGFTPQEYLKRVRLDHARARLEMPDKSITVLGVALKCCFQNQGHFARDYRLAFGERPSETLARARRLNTGEQVAELASGRKVGASLAVATLPSGGLSTR